MDEFEARLAAAYQAWHESRGRTPDRFFALYADNVHRHGTPAMPKKYFQALLDEFAAATSNLRDRCRAWLDSPQVIESIRQL